MELMKQVREAALGIEFHRAGTTTEDKLDAALAGAEVERLYLSWGLREVRGLEIDGVAADASTLMAIGPEDLCREVIAEVKRECGLTEDERKN
jgi:hypothetical protein